MRKRIPVWRRRAHNLPDVGRFVRRHSKLFTVVGALVVFLTFITREGLRDAAKDLGNELANGENEYLVE